MHTQNILCGAKNRPFAFEAVTSIMMKTAISSTYADVTEFKVNANRHSDPRSDKFSLYRVLRVKYHYWHVRKWQ